MIKDELIGQAFTLDNNKEYAIVDIYLIEENIYSYMVNTINEKDTMFAKIIFNDDDIYIEELHDAIITQKILEIIDNN